MTTLDIILRESDVLLTKQLTWCDSLIWITNNSCLCQQNKWRVILAVKFLTDHKIKRLYVFFVFR